MPSVVASRCECCCGLRRWHSPLRMFRSTSSVFSGLVLSCFSSLAMASVSKDGERACGGLAACTRKISNSGHNQWTAPYTWLLRYEEYYATNKINMILHSQPEIAIRFLCLGLLPFLSFFPFIFPHLSLPLALFDEQICFLDTFLDTVYFACNVVVHSVQ